MFQQRMPWEEDWSQPQGVQLRPADPTLPYKTTQEANQAAASGYAPPKAEADLTGTNLSNEERRYNLRTKPTYDRFGAIDKLRSDIRNDKRIGAYEAAVPIWASALNSPASPEGDLLLVNAFAKVNDPMTGVQAGEAAGVAGVAPNLEQIRAKLAKEFGADASGNFTPEARKRLREAVTVRMRELATSYNAARDEWRNFIGTAGIPNVNPETLLGRHMGAGFQQDEANWKGAPVRNLDGSTGAFPQRSHRGVMPPGDIGFAGVEAIPSGMTPQQQAAYDAFWRVNPNPSPQQLEQFGLSIGAQIRNAPAVIEARKKGLGVRPGADAIVRPPDISDRRQGNEVVDPFMRGVADTITLGLSDEIGGGLDALAGRGSFAETLARERAIRDYDIENNFGPRLTGQVAGGFALPSFGASTVRGMAGVGAGYGAAYGFGSADGGLGNRAANAVLGATAGGATGATLGAAMPLVSRGMFAAGRRFVGPSNPRQQGLLQAATEENVPINVSDLYPGALNTVSTLETIPGASGLIRGGIEAGRDAIEQRVQQLGRGGTAREDLGQVVQDAGRRTVERIDSQADRLYNRARTLAGDTPIQPQAVMQTLAGLIRQEAAVPGGTRAGAVIRQYADAFENGGPVSIDGARAMRSELLSRLREDGGLSKQAATRITGQIMGGINQDIERSLTAAGRGGAVRAYRQADRFYAQSRDEIENVIERFIGTDDRPKAVEQTISLMRDAAGQRGNSAGLTRMLARLSPDERRDYAATLVEPLGRASADEPFSPATFVRNIRQISPAARRAIFGSAGDRSIRNLVRLSNAKKETVQRLNNSRSGQVTNYKAVLSSLLFSVPGGGALVGFGAGLNPVASGAGAAVVAAGGMAGARSMARAMMNEDFTRLLAQAPATANPRAIQNHIGRLRQVAAKDPNVRSVVEAIEQNLLRAVNDNAMMTTRSVASTGREEDDYRR